jgi:hypothetical protein
MRRSGGVRDRVNEKGRGVRDRVNEKEWRGER